MTYLQGFLLQVILYSLLWIYDEYVGLLMCIIMTSIVFGLTLFAYVVELIEKSKVPKSFFKWMLISAVAPLFTLLLFSVLFQGDFNWMKE